MTGVLLIALAMFIGTTPRGDQPKGTWKHDLTLDATGTQTQFRAWTAGGDDAMSWQSRVKGQSRLSEPRMDWDWNYDLTYGQTKRGSGSFRKTSDELHLETQITRKIGLFFNPYIAGDLRTQLDNGYRYASDDSRQRISRIWDPGYTAASAGVGKEFGGGVLSVRGGLSVRQTWQQRDFEQESGAELVTKVKVPLSERAHFTSETRGFRGRGDDNWVMRNDSMLRIQVAKFITLNIGAQVLDNPAVSDKFQVRQSTTIGVGYQFR